MLEIDHSRQRLVGDRNQLGRVTRLCLGFRHDEGDAVADAAHPIVKQNRARRRETGRPAPGIWHEERWDSADLVCGGIRAGEHAQHARRSFGRADIDPFDDGVRVWRED